ncbi:MAG: hypothetical protein WAU69_03050 [Solirubrobacteraceae bacterium]
MKGERVATEALLDYERERARERLAAAGRKSAPGRPAETSRQLGGGLGKSPHTSEATAKAGDRFGVSGTRVLVILPAMPRCRECAGNDVKGATDA